MEMGAALAMGSVSAMTANALPVVRNLPYSDIAAAFAGGSIGGAIYKVGAKQVLAKPSAFIDYGMDAFLGVGGYLIVTPMVMQL